MENQGGLVTRKKKKAEGEGSWSKGKSIFSQGVSPEETNARPN